eukprot:TRINITY_DN27003_c0_g1_i1.p1 TRINITY_DN27003_c0_g1~~TRINITY_DN27003_c0_g1_i1.p1  ORF type:complete len:206 (+),score=19.91 TRINITY_DN27003_c0_g1_i1:80-697(+)
MAFHALVTTLCIFIFFSIGSTLGSVQFSSLSQTLIIKASPKQGEVLKAGEDTITVTWGLNQTFSSTVDNGYKTVKVKLCYAPISQQDRAWRKTKEDLSKDKTCQFKIVSRPYAREDQSFNWTIERDVPEATYFIRAYAVDSAGDEVAFGQTTDSHKTTSLFEIQGITGRHVSLDIAAACFSTFSLISLFGFFALEKRKGKMSEKN